MPPIIKHSSCTKGKNGKARTDKINKQMKQELIIKTGEQEGSKRCCKKIEFIYINIYVNHICSQDPNRGIV